ncbi:MAG: acyltransferase [Deltaproteobacteria bacterium]|nr:acyltransferase [Deltaproteobacteria bacterium]
MSALVLRAIHAFDRLRFTLFRRRHAEALHIAGAASPHLRFARLRIEPGGRVEIADGFATERQPGNYVQVGAGARLSLGERAWLRTEYGANRITLFEGARVTIGPDALLNGAMIHAKREISIGCESRLAFGVRILDADLHDVDRETPERIGPVRIGDRVWLGADVLVLRGVTIGDDVVVGAGSIVTRDLPPRCLALGRPAKPVRQIAPRNGTR